MICHGGDIKYVKLGSEIFCQKQHQITMYLKINTDIQYTIMRRLINIQNKTKVQSVKLEKAFDFEIKL